MIGLAGGRSVIPAKPRPGTVGMSPARNPFRSMPAQNVPPAPVRIRTRTSARPSRSSTVTRTASAIATSLGSNLARPPRASTRRGLFGLEPDAAVEADDLGIHVVVPDQRQDQPAE